MTLKDKIPPHNLEAEQAVLGALLLDWSSFYSVANFLSSQDFYSQQNQTIYLAMCSLAGENIHCDMLTLIDTLTKTGKIEAAGGVDYIASLTNQVPTSANISYYADIVLDQSIRRNLIKVSSEIKASAFDETKKSDLILEEAEKVVFNIKQNKQSSSIDSMNTIVSKTIELIDRRYKLKGEFSGITSGLTELDSYTGGFQDSEMIIVGARPSMGKTALALTMMQHIAIEKKIPCGFFSLEMASVQIGQRLVSQVSRISGKSIRDGRLSMKDFQKLQDAASICFNAPLYICDTPNMKLLDLRAVARRMHSIHGVKIIFIDYIGLIRPENEELPMHEQQSIISKSLKSLARELNIPIVVLCQLARSAEGQVPNLAELRGSGSIEQDADAVILIHGDRKENHSSNENYNPVQDRKLILAKQRNGPVGDIEVAYIANYTKFENKARE